MLVVVIGVRRVPMTLVQVVGVVAVPDHRVATLGTVLMGVLVGDHVREGQFVDVELR